MCATHPPEPLTLLGPAKEPHKNFYTVFVKSRHLVTKSYGSKIVLSVDILALYPHVATSKDVFYLQLF